MPHLFRSAQRPEPARPEIAIPLGAALLIVDLPGLPAEFDLVAVAEENPWAPIVAIKPRHEGVLAPWRRHPALRRMIVIDGPETGWERQLRHELTSWGPPDHKEVVAYVTAACPHPTFERALLAELRGAARPGRSARHAAFRSRGPLTASGWMTLYTLTRFLSLPPSARRLIDASMMLGVDQRTLTSYAKKLLGLEPNDARKGFGWKWGVERALRIHGYVPDTPPLPLGFEVDHWIPSLRSEPQVARGGGRELVAGVLS